MAMKCLLSSSGLGRRSSTVILTAMIGVLANLSATAATWGPVNIAQTPPDKWLKNCVIYTFEGVSAPGPFDIYQDPVQAGSTLFRSDVCSLGSIQLGGNANVTRVPIVAPTQADVAVVSPTISLQQYSRTSECVYDTAAGGSLTIGPQPNIVPCPVKRDVDLSVMPSKTDVVDTWLPFPNIQPDPLSPDIVVATGATLDLAPGKYGKIILNSKSKLRLMSTGSYQFVSMETKTDETETAIIVMAEKVNLMVQKYLLLGHRTRVNEARTRLFKVFVGGTDADVASWNGKAGPWRAFTYRGDGLFNACYVYSPEGTQSWRGKPIDNRSYNVQSFAKNFSEDTISAKFRVALAHPQDEECFEQEITCASIGRAFLPGRPGMICDPTTGQVQINGWELGKKTLTELMFFNENSSIPISGNVPIMRTTSCLEVPKNDMIYIPDETTVQNALVTNINPGSGGAVASLWTNCVTPPATSVRLVPVLLGPLLTPISPVCFSAYTAERLVIDGPASCSVELAP